jgi:hypothetical protein
MGVTYGNLQSMQQDQLKKTLWTPDGHGPLAESNLLEMVFSTFACSLDGVSVDSCVVMHAWSTTWIVFGKDLLLSGPPILYGFVSFKAGENEDDEDFLFAKLLIVEELVTVQDQIYQLITRPLPVGDQRSAVRGILCVM